MKNNKIYKNVEIDENAEIGDYVIIGMPPKGKKDGELKTIIGCLLYTSPSPRD